MRRTDFDSSSHSISRHQRCQFGERVLKDKHHDQSNRKRIQSLLIALYEFHSGAEHDA